MQAPMKSTAHDFWTMVVQENARYVIMLCNLVEQGKKKCHVYYPTEEGEKTQFGGMFHFRETNEFSCLPSYKYHGPTRSVSILCTDYRHLGNIATESARIHHVREV